MAVTVAGVKSKFSEFADTDVSLVQSCIDAALLNVNECAWGARYDLGVLWLSAHLLKVATAASSGGASSGLVTSKSVGDVSVSFADGSGSYGDATLGTTPYGVQYLGFRRLIFAPRCI